MDLLLAPCLRFPCGDREPEIRVDKLVSSPAGIVHADSELGEPKPKPTAPKTDEEIREATTDRLTNSGVTVRQLLVFWDVHKKNFKLHNRSTTSEVVSSIVLPATVGDQCCYMDSWFMTKHRGPRRATKVVSHAWSSTFFSTFLNILLDACGTQLVFTTMCFDEQGGFSCDKALYFLDDSVLDKVYWLCIFAVNQHKIICGDCLECRIKEGGHWTRHKFLPKVCICCSRPKPYPCGCGSSKHPLGSPACERDKIVEVVQRCQEGVVVCLDRSMKALSSMWVVWEAVMSSMSTKTAIDFAFAEGLEFPIEVLQDIDAALAPPTDRCTATYPEDVEMILRRSREVDPGGFEALHSRFVNQLELTLGKVKTLKNMPASDAEAYNHLVMDISWTQWFLSDLSTLGFRPEALDKLKNLRTLSFCCHQACPIQDLSPLADILCTLSQLETLRMHFPGCQGIRSHSLHGLQKLASLTQLHELDMDCSSCHSLRGASGLDAVLRGLTGINILRLHFKACNQLDNCSALADCFTNLTKLRYLSISLSACHALVLGVHRLFASLAIAKELLTIRLDFSDVDIDGLGSLPSALSSMSKIQTCDLDFSYTGLRDINQLADCVQGWKDIKLFKLNVRSCRRLSNLTPLIDAVELAKGRPCIVNVDAKYTLASHQELRRLHALSGQFSQ